MGAKRMVVRAGHRVPGYSSFEVLRGLVSQLSLLALAPDFFLHLAELPHSLRGIGHGLWARRWRAASTLFVLRSDASRGCVPTEGQ